MTQPLLLIDLSSVLYPIWHIATTDPNPDATARDTLARIHALAMNRPHVAICCDSRKSFRRDVDPTYKAQRDATGREPLYHQMAMVKEQLAKEGFPVWEVEGMEADDIIASAVNHVLHEVGKTGATVEVVTSDKDLLALASSRVTIRSAKHAGAIMDPVSIRAHYAVDPSQMTDYLCLVGDASDNVKGVRGIGPKIAAELLAKFKTIAAIYEAMDAGATPEITPARRTALQEFRPQWPKTRALIQLQDTVPIPFHEIFRDRAACAEPEPDPVDDLRDVFTDEESPKVPEQNELRLGSAGAEEVLTNDGWKVEAMTPQPPKMPPPPPTEKTGGQKWIDAVEAGVAQSKREQQVPIVDNDQPTPKNGQPQAMAKQDEFSSVEVLPPSHREFTMQLEPRSPRDAMVMAKVLYDSRLYGKYGSAAGIFAAILRGREMGFPAGVSVDAYHVIDGKMTMDATAIRALVLRSGKVKSFRCIERTDEAATYEAQRDDDPPVRVRYTVEDAKRAWSKGDDGWAKSGWGRNPADMCVARASSKLARLVAPDVTMGLYAPEEMDN